jgi:glucose-1-phosphatase
MAGTLRRPEALLMDLGNVMTYFSHDRMVEQMATVVGVSSEHWRVDFFDSGVFADFERGRLQPDDLLDWTERTYGVRPDLDALRIAASDIFEPNPGMHDILAAVRTNHPEIRLVAITNTCSWHLEWVATHDTVLDGFAAIASSWQVGELKPLPALYLAAIELAGVTADRCFYTDDIGAYIEAGRGHGVDAEQFVSNDMLRVQLVARGLML